MGLGVGVWRLRGLMFDVVLFGGRVARVDRALLGDHCMI